MKGYLFGVLAVVGAFLVIGLEGWMLRLAALLIFTAAAVILGMVLEAQEPSAVRTTTTAQED